MLSSSINNLNLPLEEDPRMGWKPYPLFSGSTRCMDNFSSHVSVLSPGITPHEPHAHAEEELLILLSGEADIVVPDGISHSNETRERIRPGSFVYYPAFKLHTIHNAGREPATYLMFKWRAEGASKNDWPLEASVFHYGNGGAHIGSESFKGTFHRKILDDPTGYLRKLQCHVTTLQFGAGYSPHSDPYDVALLLISGTVETMGQRVGPHSVIFYATGEPHGIMNVGEATACYLVFEFHGGACKSALMRWIRNIIFFTK